MGLPYFNHHQIAAVIDLSFGDSGKGKIVDLLCEDASLNVRGTGGANAGHTMNVMGHEIITHLVPAGILHDIENIMGRGMVISDAHLINEIKQLEAQGIPVKERLLKERLYISKDAHLTTGLHIDDEVRIDKLLKVGTTMKGVGPTYAAKGSRFGVLMGDLHNRDYTASQLRKMGTLIGSSSERVEQVLEQTFENFEFYKDLVRPTREIVLKHIKAGNNIVLEGAQGTHLSVEFGSYPMVTSSDCTASGLISGCDIHPGLESTIYKLGIAKAYATRVGNGPFPSEYGGEKSEKHCAEDGGKRWVKQVEDEEFGDSLELANGNDAFLRGIGFRGQGGEYGATTKRHRRTGAFDAVATKFAMEVNGIQDLAVMKLDVLDKIETLDMATGYTWNFTGDTPYGKVQEGQSVESYPREAIWPSKIEPKLEQLSGWSEFTTAAKSMDHLPREAVAYVNRMAEATGGNVVLVSTGPERNDTIIID